MEANDLNYDVDLSHFEPEIQARFVQEAPDPDLESFLATSANLRAGRLRTLLQRVLRGYLSDYDANGLLNIYAMHLLGTSQGERLLARPRGGRLLDIGAGSGDVTSKLAPLFDRVLVTELSSVMIRRLRRRGFPALRRDVTLDGFPDGDFDVVALLNVLDRCVNPIELLRRCAHSLTPSMQLLISLPLPYRPHAYAGAQTIDPLVPLTIEGDSWERAAASFVKRVLAPAGLELCRFTRLPYLSAGDRDRALYVLDAFVACCRTAPTGP